MIKKVLIPASGIGSRLGDITRVIPKELVPLGAELALTRLLREVKEAQFEEIAIVTTQAKAYLFEKYIDEHKVDIRVIRQSSANGLTGAIIAGEEFYQNDPFLLAFPDDFIYGCNPSKILQENYIGNLILSTIDVSDELVSEYGIVEREEDGQISKILEKPERNMTSSRESIFGRYILSKEIMPYIKPNSGVKNGGLSEGLNEYLGSGRLFGINLRGVRLDTGSPRRLAEANFFLANNELNG